MFPTSSYGRHLQSLSHLHTFANHTSVVNNLFSLGLLSHDIAWGERHALTDRSSFHCAPDWHSLVMVWVLGKIIDTAFELNGEPVKMVGIQIEPLSVSGGTNAKAIVGELSYPVICMVCNPSLLLD